MWTIHVRLFADGNGWGLGAGVGKCAPVDGDQHTHAPLFLSRYCRSTRPLRVTPDSDKSAGTSERRGKRIGWRGKGLAHADGMKIRQQETKECIVLLLLLLHGEPRNESVREYAIIFTL